MIELMIFADAATDTPSVLLDYLQGLSGQPCLLALALVLATYGSEDLACIVGGLAAAAGLVPFPLAAGACALGIWTGDMAIYLMGMLFARGALKWNWLASRMRPERMARGVRFFDKYGARWIFMSRFIPGSRVVSYLAAGAMGWNWKKFAFVLALATAVWTPLLCGLTMLAGRTVLGWLATYERHALWIMLGLLLLVWVVLKLALPMFSWRGRRLLYGRWLRLTRWEFWSVSVVYLPVSAYMLWLSVRYRGFTLFSASSPEIEHSGFAMDSKGDILALFADSGMLPAHARLPWEEDRMGKLTRFMEQNGLGWPVVLKPDIGERGRGVAIIRGEQQAGDYLNRCKDEVIAQEYVEGLEYGVYYVRMPAEQEGWLYSVARKHSQSLVGDGRKNLEQLILDDPRAVAMAPYYLRKFSARLDEVPGEGEDVMLAEIGTHARGAVFTDDRHEITPELTEAIDRVTRAAGAIHCGRFDLRVPSAEDLRAGRNIRILEFNGVTGEPAHVYQPGYPLYRGIIDLCRQWQFAYRAGHQNRAKGHRVSSIGELIDIVRAHRAKQWFDAEELERF